MKVIDTRRFFRNRFKAYVDQRSSSDADVSDGSAL